MPLQKIQNTLVERSVKLTAHHYISKHQSAYITQLKDNIKDDEAIIILDFAENYSFVVQDAAQGYHWDNCQATLHPLDALLQKRRNCSCKTCVICDHLRHDTWCIECSRRCSPTYETSSLPRCEENV